MKISDYFKWLFTRWYLYLLALLMWIGIREPPGFLWSFLPEIIIIAILISIFVGIKSLFKKK